MNDDSARFPLILNSGAAIDVEKGNSARSVSPSRIGKRFLGDIECQEIRPSWRPVKRSAPRNYERFFSKGGRARSGTGHRDVS